MKKHKQINKQTNNLWLNVIKKKRKRRTVNNIREMGQMMIKINKKEKKRHSEKGDSKSQNELLTI